MTSPTDVVAALRVLAEALGVSGAAAAADALLAFPFGLERAAAAALVRDGVLPAAKIGRRFYARRSDVLALVERLAKPAAVKATGVDVAGDLASIAAKTRAGGHRRRAT